MHSWTSWMSQAIAFAWLRVSRLEFFLSYEPKLESVSLGTIDLGEGVIRKSEMIAPGDSQQSRSSNVKNVVKITTSASCAPPGDFSWRCTAASTRRCGRRASTVGAACGGPRRVGRGRRPVTRASHRGRGQGGVGVDAALHGRLSRRAALRSLPSHPQGKRASPALVLASPT